MNAKHEEGAAANADPVMEDAILREIGTLNRRTPIEYAILHELEKQKRKTDELRERVKMIRARRADMENGRWSPLNLHVMYRQHGTTFAAISRAIQGAMCRKTRVAYITVGLTAQAMSASHRAREILKAYYSPKEKVELSGGKVYSIFKMPNNSSIVFTTADKIGDLSLNAIDRVVVDALPLRSRGDSEMMPTVEELAKVGAKPKLHIGDLIDCVLCSPAPMVDVYLSYEGVVYISHESVQPDILEQNTDNIRRLLESSPDFGAGVRSGVIPWDLNRI